MKRFVLALAAFGWTLSQGARALPGDALALDLFSRGLETESRSKGDCANFTGAWQGFCKASDGREIEQTTLIQQFACELIEIDGRVYHVGGIATGSSNGPSNGYLERTSFDWSPEQRSLTVAMEQHFRLYDQGIQIMTQSSGTYTMADDKLTTTVGHALTMRQRGGAESYTKQKVVCALARVAP